MDLTAALGAQFADLRATLPSNGSYDPRAVSTIRRVIVHHTASVQTTWTNVARYHVNKGWPGAAYHFGILPDGSVSYLGDIATLRYHAGAANTDSIGISFMGNYQTTDTPTAASLRSYSTLLSTLQSHLGKELTVQGHRDVSDTQCPGDKLYDALFVPGVVLPTVEPLPEDESPASAATLASKVRWWSEEAQRQEEAGNAARATAIRASLIKLLYRLENLLGATG